MGYCILNTPIGERNERRWEEGDVEWFWVLGGTCGAMCVSLMRLLITGYCHWRPVIWKRWPFFVTHTRICHARTRPSYSLSQMPINFYVPSCSIRYFLFFRFFYFPISSRVELASNSFFNGIVTTSDGCSTCISSFVKIGEHGLAIVWNTTLDKVWLNRCEIIVKLLTLNALTFNCKYRPATAIYSHHIRLPENCLIRW